MSTKYLKRFFKPRSIAVFGATAESNNLGNIVLGNLIDSGFAGPLMAIGEDGDSCIAGVKCYDSLASFPEVPDLAIICAPAQQVASWVRKLGAYQVKAAMILTSGLAYLPSATHKSVKDEVKDAARSFGIRILGPDCIGLLVPGSKMNASSSHINIKKGRVAYIGQSGLIGAAMIDWANGQEVGFSHFLTLGDGIDVDVPSIIDYLAGEPTTHAILLQMDRVIGTSRNFISALRAASRNKLVLVLKSGVINDGRIKVDVADGLSNADLAFDAALKRAGVVRVETSDHLFNALETLTRMKPMRGERIAIVANGMGPNALANDRLIRKQGQLSQLSPETVKLLADKLPGHWNGMNPIDLNVDATPAQYADAISILSKDPEVDVILTIHAPTRFAPSVATATEVIKAVRKTPRNVLTCWMGRETAIAARNTCNSAGITTFLTPEEAIDAFMYMVEYHRNQAVMRQTPAPYQLDNAPNRKRAYDLIQQAKESDRDYLTHAEACHLLDLYDIPTANTHYATDISAIVDIASQLGGSIAIKALHEGNIYPFSYEKHERMRWQDLALDLYSIPEVRHSATKLAYRVSERYRSEQTFGFAIQQMKRGFQSLQINLGITRDAVFGPLIVFGVGGYVVDSMADRKVMLPPLNSALAYQLVKESRAYKVIEENSDWLERDIKNLCDVLIKLSQLAIDLPEIKALEINPLLLNKRGILVIDVCVSLADPMLPAVSPYPEHLTEFIQLKKSGRPAVLRAIRGEDEPAHLEFYKQLSPESIRLRYFYSRGVPTHQELANWTQIDYDREMALIVSAPKLEGEGVETLGVVRAVTDADNIKAEFSVVVRDDLQGEGLGVVLMEKVIEYCRAKGTLMLAGSTLPANKGMQGLARKLGFKNSYNPEEDVVDMKMMLNEPSEDWQRLRLQQ
ncbi:bifunctional acetate--CoA ligase family protein/GNAT family N-acetyltransferase [Nitrincola alkalisediminis]|nr:bifunctional acetate--CoA ligase family protein/GNAT family N-acetyltransferase [Nitrincola alkalisediminis]